MVFLNFSGRNFADSCRILSKIFKNSGRKSRWVQPITNTFLISSFRIKVAYEGSDLEDDDGIAPTRPGRYYILMYVYFSKLIFFSGLKLKPNYFKKQCSLSAFLLP
jgi:hypothetical protein